MSKNFESEYKEYIENIKPDLWDKISSQLPAREQIEEEKNNIVNFSDRNQMNKPKIKFESKKKKWTTLSGIIAACFCVAILLPIYVNNREDMRHDSQANAYESHQGNANSEVAIDLNKVPDKGNKTIMIKADVEVKSVNDQNITVCITDTQDENLKIDDEITVSFKPDFSFTEGGIYSVEMSVDADGNYVIENALQK